MNYPPEIQEFLQIYERIILAVPRSRSGTAMPDRGSWQQQDLSTSR